MTIHYLVDTSWVLYRGYHSLQHVWSDFPELHFLVKKIESLLARKDAVCHLVLDGYNTKGRRILGEAYKQGRHPEGSYNVFAGLSSFLKILNNDRIKVYYNKDYESDEIIFTLSRTLTDGRKKIISGDKDILQALKEDTVIENGSNLVVTEESYKYEYAEKFFEVEPIKLPLFRAICGDSSDKLKPPVARFPKKLAAKIVKSLPYDGDVPSIEELKSVSDISSSEKKWVSRLIEAYEPFSINFDIMKLNVITDNLNCKYDYTDEVLSDFLKSKIEHLNAL